MKRYAFTGSQRVCVGGKWREPGSPEFSEDLHPVEEAWLLSIGAIKELPRVAETDTTERAETRGKRSQ